jgi:hypothetical protein
MNLPIEPSRLLTLALRSMSDFVESAGRLSVGMSAVATRESLTGTVRTAFAVGARLQVGFVDTAMGLSRPLRGSAEVVSAGPAPRVAVVRATRRLPPHHDLPGE